MLSSAPVAQLWSSTVEILGITTSARFCGIMKKKAEVGIWSQVLPQMFMFISSLTSAESSSPDPATLPHLNHCKNQCGCTQKISGVRVSDFQSGRSCRGTGESWRDLVRVAWKAEAPAHGASPEVATCFLLTEKIPLTNNLAVDIRDPALKVTVPESWHATSFRVKVWILPSCSEISVTRLLWRGVPSSHHCTFFTPGWESSQVKVADSPTKTSVFLKPHTTTAASSARQSERRCQRKTKINTHGSLPAGLTQAQVQLQES